MSDNVCFNCQYMEYKREYLYPFRCKINNHAYKTLTELMIENGIDFESLDSSCSSFKNDRGTK